MSVQPPFAANEKSSVSAAALRVPSALAVTTFLTGTDTSANT